MEPKNTSHKIARHNIDLVYPLRLTILGDMNSGKSTWVRNLFSNLDNLTNIDSLKNKRIHIIYCYNFQPGIYINKILRFDHWSCFYHLVLMELKTLGLVFTIYY